VRIHSTKVSRVSFTSEDGPQFFYDNEEKRLWKFNVSSREFHPYKGDFPLRDGQVVLGKAPASEHIWVDTVLPVADSEQTYRRLNPTPCLMMTYRRLNLIRNPGSMQVVRHLRGSSQNEVLRQHWLVCLHRRPKASSKSRGG
jgi:hypothetical protein